MVVVVGVGSRRWRVGCRLVVVVGGYWWWVEGGELVGGGGEWLGGGVRLQVKIICGRLADGHCHI